jgi:glycosyltransferase involved in cell wall biosynthesis
MCPGGAQRITLTLLHNLDREKYRPVLVTRRSGGEWMSSVPGDVPVYSLDVRVRSAWYRFGKLLRELDPDIVLSMSSTGNLTASAAHLVSRLRTPLVVAEHNTFSEVWRRKKLRFLMMKTIKSALYRNATRVLAVSQGVAEDLVRTIGVPRDRLEVIYNPIVEEELDSLAEEAVDHPWFDEGVPVIVAAGRLVEQKDYPMLLEAFRIVRARTPARLMILGDGELKGSLRRRAQELGVDADVAFLGFVENPYRYMKRCAVFVLSSRFEGFGNVIVEAMACSAPVVSTDCPSGPGEIISDGEDGFLVPVGDAGAMARVLQELLENPQLRVRIGKEGKRRSRDFSVQAAVGRYQNVISNLVRKPVRARYIAA